MIEEKFLEIFGYLTFLCMIVCGVFSIQSLLIGSFVAFEISLFLSFYFGCILKFFYSFEEVDDE